MPPRKSSKNIQMLGVVAQGLKGLGRKFVFVGGATVDLFITDEGAPATRATDDVDCVVDLAALADYHRLEERLRELGFENDMSEGAPACRWLFCGIKVDVMPSEGGFLGFSNRWYAGGVANAQEVALPDGAVVSAFTVPYLLASKLEAFRGRGKGDYVASPDLEDIVTLIDGCGDAERQTAAAPQDVRAYLAAGFAGLLSDAQFAPSIEGQFPGTAGPGRVARCLAVMRRVAAT